MKKLLLTLSTLSILNGADPIQNNEDQDKVLNVKLLENTTKVTFSYKDDYPQYFMESYDDVQRGNYLYLWNWDGSTKAYFQRTQPFKKSDKK